MQRQEHVQDHLDDMTLDYQPCLPLPSRSTIKLEVLGTVFRTFDPTATLILESNMCSTSQPCGGIGVQAVDIVFGDGSFQNGDQIVLHPLSEKLQLKLFSKDR